MAGLLGVLLDATLIVLIAVFVHLAWKRLVIAGPTRASHPRNAEGLAAMDVDEEAVTRIITERARLRDNEIYLKHRYLDGQITIEQFRQHSKEEALRIKEIERELKRLGIM